MNNLIIQNLKNNIKLSNKNKSSHWKKFLDNNYEYLDIYKFAGFGNYKKKTRISILHKILQIITFGSKIFRSEIYKKYKSVFDDANRDIDCEAIRHICTFEKLKKYLNPKKICIIGDGKLYGVLGAYLTFPMAKIYSVNLSEVLINDYLILNKMKIELKNSIEVVNNINFTDGNKKYTLVPSNYKKFLLNKNIDLFININSFQEMNIKEINNYLKIIKNNKSKLYSSNREYKKLIGGEKIYFDQYQSFKIKKIFWENCPWSQKYYSLKPPFIFKYDGIHKHALIDFS
jgi:putative sugar O-methyltransferase